MREVSVSLLICLHSYRTFYITGIAGAGIDSLRKRSRRQSTSRPHHTIPKTPILLPRSPTRSPLNVPNLVEPSTTGLLQQQKDTRSECATKMAPSPLLPQLPADDSMLTRRFGAETANYFSGNPLNRVSFLRDNRDFLQAAFAHPSARFLALDKLAPLVHTAEKSIAWITREDVAPVTGSGPFDKTEEDMINDFNSEESHPVIILLGLDDKQKMTASDQDVFQHKDYKGTPYFAVDFTENQDVVTSLASREGLSFNQDQRSLGFNPGEAAIYGQARAVMAWNDRNPFCSQCGQKTLPVHAGAKRACPPTDMAGGEKRDRKPCASRGTVSNISFPRTDPTIIVAVVSADGTKVLLGRNKRWPKYWYSTLAGFLEPGESIEEATRREVWEESGVTVGRVVLHSSQPWPFPGSLMIGAIAQALPGDGEKIFLGNDPELEDAKWFPMAEVRKALSSGVSNLGQSAPPEYVEGDLRVPPDTAIANRLMTAVVGGYNGAFPKI
ncbi:hypothetical protein PoMZ_00415 [Pyricularia oryzae]|uniref:NAD(+) diphosphatase n=1 Tax=Pyricularia oryzae TaxID=318829 RepID=A0A4P7N489_PYROR|nr:hypothetical protein PoMZ_00415 [Pyricularia oryzae]